ncbi:uncharacterized protein [Dysidea avara]|uniref:uncharacterized protein n=1 Tax=Dysidea avara TaxID=196820 RepID=UPI00331EA2A6
MGRHSFVITYLLWLPPLGWLGLHQCYLGRHYHGVVLFTTFAGFVVGWLNDLWRIPTYVRRANKEDEEGDEQRGCCSICLCCCWPVLLFRCFKRFLGLYLGSGPPRENQSSQQAKSGSSDDLSDNDTPSEPKPSDQPVNDGGQRQGANEQLFYQQLIHQQLEKMIREKAGHLLEEFVNNTVCQYVREKNRELDESQKKIILESVTQVTVTILLEDRKDNWLGTVLDGSKVEELQEKTGKALKDERVWFCVNDLVTRQQENFSTVAHNQSKKVPGPSEIDPYCSDDESQNNSSVTQPRKRTVKLKSKSFDQTRSTSSQEPDQLKQSAAAVPKHFLKVWYNFDRIGAAFLVSRYYRAVVSAAVSDYMETIWAFQMFLKLLPPLGMICGVYLVSNIGKPRRLTLSKLLLCSVVAEVLFLHVIAELQILVCLACTILTVFFWKVEPTKQPSGSSRATCLTVTLCAVTAMSLVWGSIIMNVTIEVDGDTVTVSEAFRNFYNSPGWSRMKESIWVTVTMSWEGNWDEAGETLLRMSDLAGTERALHVLGLLRDANLATIKARYKKLAREWHPDKYHGPDKEAASNKFIEIQMAYTLLTKKLRG